MKVNIQSIHFDADSKLTDFITAKCQKFGQFFDSITAVDVYLRLEKNAEIGNKIVEIKVNVPSNTLMASERARTFEEATDLCMDHVVRQVKRHKEKVKA